MAGGSLVLQLMCQLLHWIAFFLSNSLPRVSVCKVGGITTLILEADSGRFFDFQRNASGQRRPISLRTRRRHSAASSNQPQSRRSYALASCWFALSFPEPTS